MSCDNTCSHLDFYYSQKNNKMYFLFSFSLKKLKRLNITQLMIHIKQYHMTIRSIKCYSQKIKRVPYFLRETKWNLCILPKILFIFI